MGDGPQLDVAALEQLGASDLRQEWRRLFRTDPPPLSRDLTLRALAYRLQEREHGGLSKATLRRLASVTRETTSAEDEPTVCVTSVRPGARLVREWRGRTHTVTATETGFEYGGCVFASLTQVANTITGAHWSGPRFFGLVRSSRPRSRLRKPTIVSAEELRHG